MSKADHHLADEVIRDPFERPVQFKTVDAPLLHAALGKLIPDGTPRKEAVIISYPVTRPMNVIGSKVGPPCLGCKREVWVAPSMQGALADGIDAMVACMECLERVSGTAP